MVSSVSGPSYFTTEISVISSLTLTAMIYAMVANVVIPARISERKVALATSFG